MPRFDTPLRCAWSTWSGAIRRVRRGGAPALKRILLPVNYWRAIEFSYVGQHIGPPPLDILDVGSPKELPLLMARTGHNVASVDILPSEVEAVRNAADAAGILGQGQGFVEVRQADARSLPFESHSFDLVTSVSVVEHIPDNGDVEALKEFRRVLRPGGQVLLTVPYAAVGYDTFVEHDVYERKVAGARKVFYERHYDERTLRERLVDPASFGVICHELWGEGRVRMERILDSLGILRTPLSPVEWLLASLFIRRVGPGRNIIPMTACLRLSRSL